MSTIHRPEDDSLSVTGWAGQPWDRFEHAWQAGGRPRIEEFLGDLAEPERTPLLGELLLLEVYYRRRRGEQVAPEEYRRRFPGHARLVSALLAAVAPPPGAESRCGPSAGDLKSG